MNNNLEKWTAVLATGLAGVATGCMTFVSAVDTRSFLEHVENKNTDVVVHHFQIWWPCGRDLMVPLLGITSLAHAAAAWSSSASSSSRSSKTTTTWIIAGICIFSIGPYTALILGEDIESLRKSSSTKVAETTKRFCRLHHARLALAATGFGLSLFSLANLNPVK